MQRIVGKDRKCTLCDKKITFKYQSMPEWNILGDLCGDCYSEKLKQYYIAEDRRNIAKS